MNRGTKGHPAKRRGALPLLAGSLFVLLGMQQLMPAPTSLDRLYDTESNGNGNVGVGAFDIPAVERSGEYSIPIPTELRPIVDGRLDLVDIHFPHKSKDISKKNYDQLTALVDTSTVSVTFCELDWTDQKETPQNYPRYKNVIKANKELCDRTKVKAPLHQILALIQLYDASSTASSSSTVTKMHQSGFIYHESRCGSTLAANMLTVANRQQYRVYSEPDVLEAAMDTQNTPLVHSILDLMARTNDRHEKHMFVKLRSTCVRNIQTMPLEIPYLFFYRNPIDIMVSHFHPQEAAVDIVVCLKNKKNPHPDEVAMAHDAGYKNHADLPDSKICAIRLASLTHAVINHYEKVSDRGRFVNYNTVPSSLWEHHFVEHFGLQLDSAALKRVQDISGVYSKGIVGKETKEWKGAQGDENAELSKRKKKRELTKSQKLAAEEFMQSDFDFMERIAMAVSK